MAKKASVTYQQYPIRTCHSLHFCAVYNQAIRFGEQYHDGGFRRRAHVACAGRTRQGSEERLG